jgi:hypothetical protein
LTGRHSAQASVAVRGQSRPWPFSFEDGDLLSKRDDFKRSGRAGTKEDADGRKDRKEKIKQLPL